MATLTAWKFDTVLGADNAVQTLKSLQQQGLITLHDGAVVSWEHGKKKPRTSQLNDLKGAGALGGAFWGMLFGLIFFVPLLGAAIGAGLGAMTGALSDVGINDDFIRRSRDEVTEGTSALFLLTSDAVQDRVLEEFGAQRPTLIHSNLSGEEEGRLREVFQES